MGFSVSPIARLGAVLAAAVFVLDRLTKWWLLEIVNMPERGAVELTPFLNLVMVWNRGISFGMLDASGAGWRWGLTLVSAAIVGILGFWLLRATNRLLGAAIGLVMGGAIGNIYDRVAYGAVADFLDVHASGYHWPAFNAADSAITVGVAFLLYDAVFSPARTNHGIDEG